MGEIFILRSDFDLDTDGVMQLFALLILVMLSAFFSSAETSLTTVNRVRLKALAEEGNKKAEKALEVLLRRKTRYG